MLYVVVVVFVLVNCAACLAFLGHTAVKIIAFESN